MSDPRWLDDGNPCDWKAMDFLKSNGFTVMCGVIIPPSDKWRDDDQLRNAVHYLVSEWDYTV